MEKQKIFYWLEIPGKWYYKRKWHDYPLPGSSNIRHIHTAKKAFNLLDIAPKGSILIRFKKHVEGKGWLTDEWIKVD